MATLYINAKGKKATIKKELYGNFSEHLGRCIYEGIYVGEDSSIPNINGMRTDVVEALKKMKLPVLRWPGGCFADEYHWMDGIGPKQSRKRMINTHWGGVVEDNSFGTHEFMELCRQIGCETYINGNLGSGTVREMSEWVEYMTFDGVSPMAELRKTNGQDRPWNVDFFGVGNENWGCGGNMRPKYYADEYRRYQTYVRNYHPDKKIYKIACGANAGDFNWTEQVMQIAGNYMDGISLHYYTIPTGDWNEKGSATDFDELLYYQTLKKTLYMEELISRHGAILNAYDPKKRVGLIIDEWGTWYDVEPGTNPGFLYQQNTMRDAVVAGINLNLFNEHCDRVRMANIAQLVNVLQAVILTEGEKMLLTPTYHVFEMYKHHQDATLLESNLHTEMIGIGDQKVPCISQSVSEDREGKIQITLVNLSATEECPMEILLHEREIEETYAEVLTDRMDAKNTFEQKDRVKKEKFSDIKVEKEKILFKMPSCSVMHITLE